MRHQLTRLLRRLRDPRWDLILAVAPDQALGARDFPGDLMRTAQGPGDLGQRMARVMRGLPPGPVAIIGADIPGGTRAHVARAFTTLGDHEAVFGPAPDGGYWLVGMKRGGALPAGLFMGVRWSGPHALADSMAGLKGMRIGLIDILADVDDATDLRN
jgi:glycosyltransferase A (GT-A) superfamily protein (DUF2064 family)